MARNATICMDGKSSVDQGDYFPQQSVGSSTVRADLDTIFAWYDLIRPMEVAPEPIPIDENGIPFRLCSHCGEYVKRAGFSKDAARPDGLDCTCKTCRHEQYLKGKVTRAVLALTRR